MPRLMKAILEDGCRTSPLVTTTMLAHPVARLRKTPKNLFLLVRPLARPRCCSRYLRVLEADRLCNRAGNSGSTEGPRWVRRPRTRGWDCGATPLMLSWCARSGTPWLSLAFVACGLVPHVQRCLGAPSLCVRNLLRLVHAACPAGFCLRDVG